VFCLSSKSGFVAEQWVGEESKLLESGVNIGYCGWTSETEVGVEMTPETGGWCGVCGLQVQSEDFRYDFRLELLNPMIFIFKY
jgi:hypothetical protein